MTTKVIDAATHAELEVEAERGYNRACDEDDLKKEAREEALAFIESLPDVPHGCMAAPIPEEDWEYLQRHSIISEGAEMNPFDAETLVVESKPLNYSGPKAERARIAEIVDRWHDAALQCEELGEKYIYRAQAFSEVLYLLRMGWEPSDASRQSRAQSLLNKLHYVIDCARDYQLNDAEKDLAYDALYELSEMLK